MHTSRLLSLLALIAGVAAGAAGRAPHARLDLLAQGSLEVGRVSYEQIASAFYGGQLDEIMAAKRAWRLAHPDQIWASDYDLLLKVAVNVEIDERGDGRNATEGVLARYTLETNTARIPRASAGAMLAHEVAHGLTRRSIRTAGQCARVDERLALDAAPPTDTFARQSGFHLEWLSYVSTQVEFEVRLQALNRYHFEMTGRVIDSPRRGPAGGRLARRQSQRQGSGGRAFVGRRGKHNRHCPRDRIDSGAIPLGAPRMFPQRRRPPQGAPDGRRLESRHPPRPLEENRDGSAGTLLIPG